MVKCEYSAAEFCVRGLQVEGCGAQFLDSGHGKLDSRTQSWKGLIRALLDGEELLVGHKASASLLLNKERR